MASILIIDDSSYMRGKIRSILSQQEHEIEEAADGMKGLQLASSRSYDLVLLDIIMPEMDGVKILDAIKQHDSKTPVIIVTADIQESVYRQCMGLGAFAVLHKPPKEEDLLETVGKALSALKEHKK